jgi:hypothetical protein
MTTKILVVIIIIFSVFSITSFVDLIKTAFQNRGFKGLTGEIQFFLLCFSVLVYFTFMYLIKYIPNE